jgi:hypothetical protein
VKVDLLDRVSRRVTCQLVVLVRMSFDYHPDLARKGIWIYYWVHWQRLKLKGWMIQGLQRPYDFAKSKPRICHKFSRLKQQAMSSMGFKSN